jgi:hypothetical protein
VNKCYRLFMSSHDAWLLEGSEGDGWSDEDVRYGLCEYCEQPMEEGGCKECGPYLPELLASFTVVAGVVKEVG